MTINFHNIRKICIIIALVFVTNICHSGETTACFDRIIQPGGWELPKHDSTIIKKGTLEGTGTTKVTYTSFGVSEMFSLPFYSINGKALTLNTFWFRADDFKRLEVDGVPFAYLAIVRGVHIGSAGIVWWVDRDGSGKFEEFAWHPNISNIPDWVLKHEKTGVEPKVHAK